MGPVRSRRPDGPRPGAAVERAPRDLERLSAEYAALDDADVTGSAADGFERQLYRSSLDARMRGLWQRARAELGRSYAIGLLGPGMTSPAWSPGEAGAPAADDIPF